MKLTIHFKIDNKRRLQQLAINKCKKEEKAINNFHHAINMKLKNKISKNLVSLSKLMNLIMNIKSPFQPKNLWHKHKNFEQSLSMLIVQKLNNFNTYKNIILDRVGHQQSKSNPVTILVKMYFKI